MTDDGLRERVEKALENIERDLDSVAARPHPSTETLVHSGRAMVKYIREAMNRVAQ